MCTTNSSFAFVPVTTKRGRVALLFHCQKGVSTLAGLILARVFPRSCLPFLGSLASATPPLSSSFFASFLLSSVFLFLSFFSFLLFFFLFCKIRPRLARVDTPRRIKETLSGHSETWKNVPRVWISRRSERLEGGTPNTICPSERRRRPGGQDPVKICGRESDFYPFTRGIAKRRAASTFLRLSSRYIRQREESREFSARAMNYASACIAFDTTRRTHVCWELKRWQSAVIKFRFVPPCSVKCFFDIEAISD